MYAFRSESAGSSTFVVFILYTPLVITMDPDSIKVYLMVFTVLCLVI